MFLFDKYFFALIFDRLAFANLAPFLLLHCAINIDPSFRDRYLCRPSSGTKANRL